MEPWYETPLYFIITALIFWVGRGLDMWSSDKTNWMYGVDEGNPLMRDKDHQHVMSKDILVSGIYFGVSCLIGLVSRSWGAATAICIIPGVGSYIVAYLNIKKADSNRVEQISRLRDMRDNPTGNYDIAPFVSRNGKSFSQLFQWLWVPTTSDLSADAGAAASKIYARATTVPESQWFVK